MIITTTENVPGYDIQSYHDVVFANVYVGLNFFKDFGASFRNLVGGRSKGYEKALINGFDDAKEEIAKAAEKVGANAVIGLSVDIEASSGMGLITVTGTAVTVVPKTQAM
ncbi:MAG: YbjQ family protein [Aerococcus sp.]|nr:YbjQ family protein [Aerococcus sp.]